MIEKAPRVGLVLLDEVRVELNDRLCNAGYDVFTVSDKSLISMMAKTNRLDAWVFDAREEDVFDMLEGTNRFILPADNPPTADSGQILIDWCDGLLKQLDGGVGSVIVGLFFMHKLSFIEDNSK